MAARAVGSRPAGSRRTLLAGALVAAALAALLVAWFSAGWGEVRSRQREAETAPVAAADAKRAAVVAQLRGQLDGLIVREARRPYFHYQNLFHDPRAGNAAPSVAPSPLASAPEDPLVRGYFQVDARGRITTPTINDDAPELSDPLHVAENRAFRDAVIRDFSKELAPHALVASAGTKVAPPVAVPVAVPVREPASQVVRIDNNSYAQNAAPTQVYQQQQISRPRPVPVEPSTDPVTITVSPFEWRTMTFEGRPALVAMREVHTPDGTLEQGFVVDGTALTSFLASAMGDMVAVFASGADALGASTSEVLPSWSLSVTPNPHVLAEARDDAASLARAFVARFVGVGLLAVIAGVLAVMLVSRAERLARERSQFAAAAAHELRTPLAGLQLYGDMLAGGLGDPAKQSDYARRMSEEASRLGRVVSNVLGFSQLERGNLSLSPTVGSVADALRELAERAEPALDRAGCALSLDVAPELAARFDRDALARIVGNLVDNAEKYGRGADDRTIGITARAAASVIEIVVSDHGPGIANQSRLFRPFSRGVNPDGPAGLGLGLALSQSLARAMGGDLAYRPSASGGASFVLTLPVA